MFRDLLKLLILTFSITTLTLSSQSHIHMMVNKLFDQLCTQDERQTISLYECQPKIIQHDKKMKSYRNDQEYKMETFYMMTKYDSNKDKRLSKQETLAMAYDIATGDINQRVVKHFWQDYGPKDQLKVQQQVKEEINPGEEEL